MVNNALPRVLRSSSFLDGNFENGYRNREKPDVNEECSRATSAECTSRCATRGPLGCATRDGHGRPSSSHEQETLWLDPLAGSLILPATSVPLPCARRFSPPQPLAGP